MSNAWRWLWRDAGLGARAVVVVAVLAILAAAGFAVHAAPAGGPACRLRAVNSRRAWLAPQAGRLGPRPLSGRGGYPEFAVTPDAAQRTLRERAVDHANRLGERFLRWLDRFFARRSLVGDHTFFDPAEFPWVARLEAGFPQIRAELDEVLRFHADLPNFQDISTDQYQLTDDDRWKTFFFYGYGFKAGKNVDRCPDTDRLLGEIPGMTTAMFSILSPYKKIPPHGGPYKGVLRYHLGLLVPEPVDACGIRVGHDVRQWREGQSLVFDDTFEHEAWNDTDGVRVVLFVDFKRPLRGPARWLNEAVLKAIGVSPFIQDAKVRHNAWERRFEQIRSRGA